MYVSAQRLRPSSPTARSARCGRSPWRVGADGFLLAGTAALSACTGGDDATAEAASEASTSAAVDTDSVQTDAPASEADVVITYAALSPDGSTIEVSAFVQGLIEDGGSCTATATPADGDPVSGPGSTAESGPSTTECGALSVPLDEESDSWTVAVSYTSDSTELTSPSTEVQIP